MRAVLALVRRDLHQALTQGASWSLLVVMAVLAPLGAFEVGDLLARDRADLGSLWQVLPWLLVLWTPLLALRGWPEERANGLLEWLSGLGLGSWRLASARLISASVLGWLGLAMTAPLVVLIHWLGTPDLGLMLSGYLGMALLVMALASLGQALAVRAPSALSAWLGALVLGLALMLPGTPAVTSQLAQHLAPHWVQLLDLISLPAHLTPFSEGRPTWLDASYFLLLTLAGLVLQARGLSQERHARKQAPQWLVTAALAAAVTALLLAGVRLPPLLTADGHNPLTRAHDLTATRQHSLSPASRAVLDDLEAPVTLTLAYSERFAADLPQLRELATRIETRLAAFAREPQIRLKRVDPAPDSADFADLEAQGLTELSLPGGEEMLFGLVVDGPYAERRAIPLLKAADIGGLEAQVTRQIQEVSRTEPPRLGVVSRLPVMGQPSLEQGRALGSWGLMEHLNARLRIDWLSAGDDAARPIADQDALLVIAPRLLPVKTLEAITAYLERGGRVLMLVDPLPEMLDQPAPASEALTTLLARAGLELRAGEVVADAQLALPIGLLDGTRALSPTLLGLSAAQLSDAALNLNVEQLVMSSAGWLAPLSDAADASSKGPGAQDAPLQWLIRGSDEARLIPAARVHASRMDPRPLSGLAGETPPAGGLAVLAQWPAAGAKGGQLLVVSDVDMASDRLWRRTAADGSEQALNANARWLENAVDLLAGSPELVALRARAHQVRELTRLHQLADRQAAEETRLRNAWQTRLSALGATPVSGKAEAAQQSDALAAMQQDFEDALSRQQREANAERDALRRELRLWTLLALPVALSLLGELICWRRYRASRRAGYQSTGRLSGHGQPSGKRSAERNEQRNEQRSAQHSAHSASDVATSASTGSGKSAASNAASGKAASGKAASGKTTPSDTTQSGGD
ncbi:GldG family protein [Cobetia amphilecti]|uniref:GldG family protein n=1 Tax=Cobetia amphilecti TaxID=1055104 RepID=UPI001CDAB644|nr:GldG family protein [Cobetia amphilecti]UBU49639.1 GldG family protein [Cobetia amphilecti]